MTRVMEHNKICTCKWCNKSFEAAHYNAETCSPKCRKAYSRWQQGVSLLLAEIDYRLDQLKEYKDTEADSKALKALDKIAKRAKDIVNYW